MAGGQVIGYTLPTARAWYPPLSWLGYTGFALCTCSTRRRRRPSRRGGTCKDSRTSRCRCWQTPCSWTLTTRLPRIRSLPSGWRSRGMGLKPGQAVTEASTSTSAWSRLRELAYQQLTGFGFVTTPLEQILPSTDTPACGDSRGPGTASGPVTVRRVSELCPVAQSSLNYLPKHPPPPREAKPWVWD